MTGLNYGSADPRIVDLAHKNFVEPSIDTRSFGTTPIELLSKDGKDTIMGTATGFFWLHQDQVYLVTNWHVVSGRNPFSGEVMSPLGYTPAAFHFYGVKAEVTNGQFAIERRRFKVTLGPAVEKVLETPPRLEGGPIDLWAMRIPNDVVIKRDGGRTGIRGGSDLTSCINENTSLRIATQAGDECVMLGYPLRNYEGAMLPIWKRGMIASDVMLGVNGRPIFLVDAATTSGMSGSPIFRRVTAQAVVNEATQALHQRAGYEFIGVYAGRLQSADMTATNLGYAWFQVVIPDAIRQFESTLAEQIVPL